MPLPPGHDHGDGSDDESFALRQAKTVPPSIITYCGYGLVIAAGFAMANQFGMQGAAGAWPVWGLAGFACFQLAPAMGLEPELPGVPTGGTASPAALVDRLLPSQRPRLWRLLAYGHGLLPRLAAIVLLAIPHIIGAPHLAEFTGVVPPELASALRRRAALV